MNQYTIYQPPKVTHHLYVADNFVIHCTGKVPNRFHRWTLRLVFGMRIVPCQEETP